MRRGDGAHSGILAVAGKFLARRPLVVYTYTYADINSKLVLLFLFDEVNVVAEQQTVLQLAAAMSDAPAPIYQRVKQAIVNQIRAGIGNRTSACPPKVNW